MQLGVMLVGLGGNNGWYEIVFVVVDVDLSQYVG